MMIFFFHKLLFKNFFTGLILIFISIFCFNPLSAQTITVKQDGSGDYTVIQVAVNVALDGDTVMVYPGIYYENVDVTGKGIVLASTWILNQNDSVIHQTILDGNQNGSCIKTLSGTIWSEVIGFTIQNGNGTNLIVSHPEYYGNGGGIMIDDAKLKVSHCYITQNFGWHGGGICCFDGSIHLIANTIFNNWAVGGGGGIRTASSEVEFDTVLLNNFYQNFSAFGSDIAIRYNDNISQIRLDTCTVLNPDQYYIGCFNEWAVHVERPPISVLHAKISQINQDLYVSTDGNDNNSGLSPEDPLKTISFALIKIASDSLNIKTVHVADGIYSNSLTGEHTPIQFKEFVKLCGQSRDNTIIDCEDKYEGGRFAFGQNSTWLKNLTFINGNGKLNHLSGAISTGHSKKIVLDSLAFINNQGDIVSVLYSVSNDSLFISNTIVKECYGYELIDILNTVDGGPCFTRITSSIFSDNKPDMSDLQMLIAVNFGSVNTPGDINYGQIINCQFNDNSDSTQGAYAPGPVALSAYNYSNLDVVNCTFSGNATTNPFGGALNAAFGSVINLYNCILYGNDPYQVCLINNIPEESDTLRVFHSLIQDGQQGIVNFGVFNQVLWGEGNLDDDPLFIGSGDYPYAIDAGSPCIDAGTTELPPGITLPDHDLAGNPRVWGTSVDMGAYEFGPWVKVPSVGSQHSAVSSQISVSPNPFSAGTYINYEMKKDGVLDISVFSLSGSKLRTLVSSRRSATEKGRFYWDGSNFAGNRLKPGTYLVRMAVDGVVVETEKVVVSE